MSIQVKIPAGVQIAKALFSACYPHGRLISQSETQWASATFHGARHNFTIRFDGPGSHTFAETLIEQICNDDIEIRGHLVADITAPGQRFETVPECYAEVDVAVLTLAN